MLSMKPKLSQKILIEKERNLSHLDLLRLLALAFNQSDNVEDKKNIDKKLYL